MRSLFRRLDAGEAVFDFIGTRKRWYAVTAAIVLLCLGSFIFRGFNLGIEFEGGTSFQFAAATATVEEAQETVEAAGAEIATTPQVAGSLGTRQIIVKTGELSVAEQTRVSDALEQRFGQQVTVQSVSSSWGGDITSAAIRALIVFLVGVCIFIAIRFEWKMAVGAIAALFHDLVLTAGIYSLVGFEVTPSTIVGLLTILGFSLYDTVVVFDKVDENVRGILGGSRATYSTRANLAVNETLMRSINTSLIALLPVAGLLFVGAGVLGVGTIKDLALVLFVGLAAGAYSSIFLATPIVADLKEREPRYQALAKRVAAKNAGAEPAIAGARRRRAAQAAAAEPVEDEPPASPAEADDADEPVPATSGLPVSTGLPSGSGASPAKSAGGPRPGARPKRPAQKRGGGGRPSAKKRR